jgi:DNA-binding protein Fis
MDWFLIPSITAIIFKIVIFLRYQSSLRSETFNLCVLFLAVFLLNVVELIALGQSHSDATTLVLLIAYHCSAIFIVHAFLNIALDYSNFIWNAQTIKLALNFVLAALTVALVFSRNLIADWTILAGSYIPTKEAGSLYWLFQFYTLGGIAFAVGLLIHGMNTHESNLQRRQCMVFLLASATPVLITAMIIILQAVGLPLSAGIFMSLASTVMLAVIVYAEEKSRLFKLMTLLPYSNERKLHNQLLEQITECVSINDDPDSRNQLNLKDMMKALEGTVVEHVLHYYQGNQKMTASALGVSEATLSRRVRGASQRKTSDTDQDSIRITQ